ncbi:hypothetical protein TanjilG_22837 [Lupinus angustifolius]|uniref:Uncharacterized protein n=1 Tax=Lupinus angustifolius TaxID=3871 RepID=A0A4P1RIB0_LUPAN|nr:hypothetical protein TanjilG_22837 [Lupinus angustifolius]
MTHLRALYGRFSPDSFGLYFRLSFQSRTECLTTREIVVNHLVKKNLYKAQQRMKAQIDKNKGGRTFVVTEWV